VLYSCYLKLILLIFIVAEFQYFVYNLIH